jgi:hypothetical protein
MTCSCGRVKTELGIDLCAYCREDYERREYERCEEENELELSNDDVYSIYF